MLDATRLERVEIMSLREELTERLGINYRICGREIGYWANYFIRDLKRHGGLKTIRRILQQKTPNSVGSGLQRLANAGRLDLSVEAVALNGKFKPLFTKAELVEAKRRLGDYSKPSNRRAVRAARNFPDEVDSDAIYTEGSTRRVTINYYERKPAARKACLAKYGTRCAACDMSFERRYGEIGRGFIHVHHKIPLSLRRKKYKLQALRDLIPVCPNCHAMLHARNPPLEVDELRACLTHE